MLIYLYTTILAFAEPQTIFTKIGTSKFENEGATKFRGKATQHLNFISERAYATAGGGGGRAWGGGRSASDGYDCLALVPACTLLKRIALGP